MATGADAKVVTCVPARRPVCEREPAAVWVRRDRRPAYGRPPTRTQLPDGRHPVTRADAKVVTCVPARRPVCEPVPAAA